MCGIAGFIGLDSRDSTSPEVLKKMLRRIVHRGPDEGGQLVDGELAMGMRRLSIIDLADGTQPIYSEDGRYAVVFNGEIYNYRELKEELLKRGHRFKTASDTEVIVHLYEDFGVDCVQHLRGMFGLSVWDNQERTLFVARDRLGIKPLYYTECNGVLAFASEVKALLEYPGVHAEMDLHSLDAYLALKYVPSPRTLIRGIHSIPPGHYLMVRRAEYRLERYWDIPTGQVDSSITEEEATNRLLELLRESVRLRLRSDVPFGAFLSGGVDSSIIVALMAEALEEPVKTFSVGFDGSGIADELPYAKTVADRFGCEHHTLRIEATDFLEHAEKVSWHLDQPIADQATVATFMVARLARQHVKMVLTGEGGDELFAGYARYAGEQYSPWFRPIPGPVRQFLRWAAGLLPGLRRPKIALHALTSSDESTRYVNWFPMLNDELRQSLYANTSLNEGEAVKAFRLQLQSCRADKSLQRMLYVDAKLWLPDYLLLRGDKLTMANSLEARVPLLDHHLVEFASQLPERMKLNRRTRKYLLKRAASKLLPPGIIHRKKQGFPIPIDRWLRNEARPMMRDLLSQQTIAQRGLFNYNIIDQLMKRHDSGFADHSTELWGLMSLEIWMQQFVDRQPSNPLPSHGEGVAV